MRTWVRATDGLKRLHGPLERITSLEKLQERFPLAGVPNEVCFSPRTSFRL